jgi:hypothetical protein
MLLVCEANTTTCTFLEVREARLCEANTGSSLSPRPPLIIIPLCPPPTSFTTDRYFRIFASRGAWRAWGFRAVFHIVASYGIDGDGRVSDERVCSRYRYGGARFGGTILFLLTFQKESRICNCKIWLFQTRAGVYKYEGQATAPP